MGSVPTVQHVGPGACPLAGGSCSPMHVLGCIASVYLLSRVGKSGQGRVFLKRFLELSAC